MSLMMGSSFFIPGLTLILGPPASGKSTFALQAAFQCARMGESACFIPNDETVEAAHARAKRMGLMGDVTYVAMSDVTYIAGSEPWAPAHPQLLVFDGLSHEQVKDVHAYSSNVACIATFCCGPRSRTARGPLRIGREANELMALAVCAIYIDVYPDNVREIRILKFPQLLFDMTGRGLVERRLSADEAL